MSGFGHCGCGAERVGSGIRVGWAITWLISSSSFLERTLVYWGGESSSWWFIFSKDLKLLHTTLTFLPLWLRTMVSTALSPMNIQATHWFSVSFVSYIINSRETVSTVRCSLFYCLAWLLCAEDSDRSGRTQGYFVQDLQSVLIWMNFHYFLPIAELASVQLYKWKLLLQQDVTFLLRAGPFPQSHECQATPS